MNRTILIILTACVLSASSCDQQRNERTEQRAVRPTTPKNIREQLTGLWFGYSAMLSTTNTSTHWIEVGATDTIAISESQTLESLKNVVWRGAFRLQDSLLIIEGWDEEMMIDELTDSTFRFGPKRVGSSIRVTVPELSTLRFNRIR